MMISTLRESAEGDWSNTKTAASNSRRLPTVLSGSCRRFLSLKRLINMDRTAPSGSILVRGMPRMTRHTARRQNWEKSLGLRV
jgi:hypothetical protein